MWGLPHHLFHTQGLHIYLHQPLTKVLGTQDSGLRTQDSLSLLRPREDEGHSSQAEDTADLQVLIL